MALHGWPLSHMMTRPKHHAGRCAQDQRGLLVNVVDQPAHCDFTTPAFIDRDPVLIAIGTGGASAGLAKRCANGLRHCCLPVLASLASAIVRTMRDTIAPDNCRIVSLGAKPSTRRLRKREYSTRWPIKAMSEFDHWLKLPDGAARDELVTLNLSSPDPDDLTLRQARLLGQADHIFHTADVPDIILIRARADATRQVGGLSDPLPAGLVLHLLLQSSE